MFVNYTDLQMCFRARPAVVLAVATLVAFVPPSVLLVQNYMPIKMAMLLAGPCFHTVTLLGNRTRGQSNLTKSSSRGAHSPVRGHPRGSKVVPLNSWGRVSY